MENRSNELSIKVNDFAIFEDRHFYTNPTRVFFAYFGCIPNNVVFTGVDGDRVRKWIEKELGSEIARIHYRRAVTNPKKEDYTEKMYLFRDELLIRIDRWNDVLMLHSDHSAARANTLVKSISRFRSKQKPSLYVITDNGHGLQFTDLNSNKPSISIDTHYNDDFREAHQRIMSGLRKKKESGLFLLHGEPGTGKSTYLRYLIHHVKKEVIFMPPKIAADLDNPHLFNMLTDKPNSVIVIEDAENLISSRNKGGNAGISMLLNMTDGLLGDSLCLQFVCTFNTPLSNIDTALLRKGRLKATYEFAPLSVEKSAALLRKRGIENPRVTSPMSLADIYHYDEKVMWLAKEKKSVGFAYSG